MYAISIEPGVREEAVQVLYRTVRDLPQSRFAVMRGMANFILRIPDDYPLLIHTSLGRLVQLLHAWRACLAEEASSNVDQSKGNSKPGVGSKGRSTSSTTLGLVDGERSNFDPSGMDAVGLIFLCSVDVQIRRTALELLRCVRALQNDINRYAMKDTTANPPSFVIDVFEETGVSY